MNTPPMRKILSSGLAAEVEHCPECEILHLHIGAFTLRLKPAVLLDLRDTLSRALSALPATALQSVANPRKSMRPRPPGGSCH